MKSSVLLFSSAAVLLVAAAITVATSAQTPATPLRSGPAPPPAEAHIYPPPINLKVLPKDLTGQQVHEIMERWSAALGVHCNSCHVEDRNNIGPNGQPTLDFGNDSKGMKLAARTMYAMTEKINTEYVAKINSSGLPVTCGICHRGQMSPEPFNIQPPANPPTAQLPKGGEENPPAQ
ncbi:MAG: c-type cytochrome [Terracidiphilus sp.]